jgi:TetR/AcrR family transcriptional regulator, transcriptional repressor of bet genes
MSQSDAMSIDHEKRRADIAEMTIDLVAREGIGAATIRRIAAEAGCSTTAVTHYFADKQELLAWAFQILSTEGERRFEDARRSGSADAIGALLTMVPWCPANVRRWKAYLAFWDQGARDPELACLLARSTGVGLSFMRQLLRGAAAAEADVEPAAQLLNALVQGLALQMLVDLKEWDESSARSVLEDAFDLALLKVARPGAAGA